MSAPFSGLCVALATPFTPDQEVDFPAYRRLVKHVVEGGVDGLWVLGTTGEAATVTDSERDALITATLEESQGRQVIVGTGSNDTRKTIAMTRRAQELGAHGALVITPYYNKPMPSGIVAHFKAIAEAVPGFPLVVYNVPGRTGINLAPATLAQLWEIPQVVALKESTGNMAQISEILRTLPQGKALLSGDDYLALATIAMGGAGLVSVIGNALPRQTKTLVELATAGRRAEAAALHAKLYPLMDALFTESNPIPVKALLAQLGICGDMMRLPLLPAQATTHACLAECLKPVLENA
ncbi:4-hydroxy-tetrahydrodipicolinate synthase [Holophaga foetida]|uniref:4-hydroxy-tetrahydrodipicolinate synthase n=1 Tax=Holophaga foetida TaxID=35839 RepID=UPI0002473B65|nr:4-hydroxy-tetrahydrodipicolinate synthase [Holophaga foetida]